MWSGKREKDTPQTGRGVSSADIPGLNSQHVEVSVVTSLPACEPPLRGPATSTMDVFTVMEK